MTETTSVFEVDPNRFDGSELDEAARILVEGGVVGFPTETVYGLGCNAHSPEGLHKLQQLKDRPDNKPFSVHIADVAALDELVEDVPSQARMLAELYWPGPLTLVLNGHAGMTVGIRFPSHPVAREFIRRAGVPVLAPSANRAGEPPATTASGVLEVFDGKIDALIDSGEVSIRQASSVVRVEDDQVTVLREGIITEEMIHRALRGKTVLFVCTGNSCRSPMAEALFRKHLSERIGVPIDQLADHGFRVRSAGVAAFSGGQASQHAIDVMAEQGLDISSHRASPVTRELVEEADLIIALSPSHRWQLIQWDRSIAEKVEVIRELGVMDPIGGSKEGYRECAHEIETEIKNHWLEKVQKL